MLENEGRWESLSERDRQRVEALAAAIVKRLLHEPTLQLKNVSGENAHARMQVVRELFGLEEPDEEGLAEVRPLRRPAS